MTLSEEPTCQFETMGAAITRLRELVPRPILERYFVGEIWAEIENSSAQTPDAPSEHGCSMRRLLATYAINIACQGLYFELSYGQKIENSSLVDLGDEEKRNIRLAIDAIIDFVQLELCFKIEEQGSMPFVPLV